MLRLLPDDPPRGFGTQALRVTTAQFHTARCGIASCGWFCDVSGHLCFLCGALTGECQEGVFVALLV